LQFVAVIQYPKVNAIEILAGGSSAPSIPSSTSSGTIRVNAGGSSYTDSHGNAWSADYGYSGGSTYSTGSYISNTSDQTLYQPEHFAPGSFYYQFSVPNGTYTVNLNFAEICFVSPGQRVFSVA